MRKVNLETQQRRAVLAAMGVRPKDVEHYTDFNIHSNKVKVIASGSCRLFATDEDIQAYQVERENIAKHLVDVVRSKLDRDDVISVTPETFWGGVVVHFKIPKSTIQARRTKRGIKLK